MDTAVVSLLISAAGFLLTFWGTQNTVNRGAQDNARETGKILQSIENLKETVGELKGEIAANAKKYAELEHRVSQLERFADSDYKKMTSLNERLERLENHEKN